MMLDFCVSVMFPSPDSLVCFPLPSNGSRRRHKFRDPAVPRLHRYYGFVRLLRHPSAPSRFPSMSSTCCIPQEPRSSPKFLGNPFEGVPWARDSGGSSQPRITVARLLSSTDLTMSTPQLGTISELILTARSLAAYASTPSGHPMRGKACYRPARYGFSRIG